MKQRSSFFIVMAASSTLPTNRTDIFRSEAWHASVTGGVFSGTGGLCFFMPSSIIAFPVIEIVFPKAHINISLNVHFRYDTSR